MNPIPSARFVGTASPLNLKAALVLVSMALVSFHLSYLCKHLSFLMVVFLASLFQLSRLGSNRLAFYVGLGMGLAMYGPHLSFFCRIFGPAAVVLWMVLAFWIGVFLLLSRLCRVRFGPVWAAALAPFLWTGLEYFRSELYYLRFSWLNVGFAFSDSSQVFVIAGAGVYGIGFALMAGGSLIMLLPRRIAALAGGLLLVALGVGTNLPAGRRAPASPPATIRVAGMQMEFPGELEVVPALDQIIRAAPASELLVLSEYTFDGPVPGRVREWCQRQSRHLIVGGKEPLDETQFFNTAFVIGPQGTTLFEQAKSVPIQFFKDGRPARQQRLWASPWGRIGLAICYDLSYARVMDQLVRRGAQALIIPTMDVAEWGGYEHRLHARVAPMRAAEYGLPVFRVASSGISQLIDARGRVLASAPFPGESAVLAGELPLARRGGLPHDRLLAPVALAVTGAVVLVLMLIHVCRRLDLSPPGLCGEKRLPTPSAARWAQ